MNIRVLVVDDQALVREGLVILLERMPGIQVVGSAADGPRALAMINELRPAVVLMDLRMPGMGGVEATRRALVHHPDLAILALTTFPDDRSLFAALAAGARGYLTKDATPDEIADALATVADGGTALSGNAQARIVAAALERDRPPAHARAPGTLTVREAEILGLVAQGLRNDDIAGQLMITTATVKTHINNIFAKIGVTDRAQAVGYAFRHGLVAPPP